MFYLGTPNTSGAPDLIPSFTYSTLKARSKSLARPWVKQPDVIPFRTKQGTYYADTASPGHIVKQGDEYLMFISASMKRTLGIARTKDLNGPWAIDPQPIVSPEDRSRIPRFTSKSPTKRGSCLPIISAWTVANTPTRSGCIGPRT